MRNLHEHPYNAISASKFIPSPLYWKNDSSARGGKTLSKPRMAPLGERNIIGEKVMCLRKAQGLKQKQLVAMLQKPRHGHLRCQHVAPGGAAPQGAGLRNCPSSPTPGRVGGMAAGRGAVARKKRSRPCGGSFCHVHFYSPSGVPAPCKASDRAAIRRRRAAPQGRPGKATKMRMATISIKISEATAKAALGLLSGQKRQQKTIAMMFTPGSAGENDGPHPAEDGHAVADSTFAAHGGRSFR